ncbi:hypothetical protein Ccrd_010485, partial [Cynara cardunculus var. scolymus]
LWNVIWWSNGVGEAAEEVLFTVELTEVSLVTGGRIGHEEGYEGWKKKKAFKTSRLMVDIVMLPGLKSKRAKITIINDVSGVIKPGRMTLLLGPPGCGKTSLLKALSGNLNKSLKISGEISYNGYKLEEFVPQKTATYISQNDLHIPKMTVRETLDFSSRCQGTGSRAEIMVEVNRREKEGGIIPDPDVDTFMKAISIEGQKTTLQTNYILKILGLDICADTMFGDAMRRGISGGQKKRLTTGEMIVGPTKALFMDEISNGLDSSTTYQIIACLQQLAHITDASVLISLLQPSPEAFDLFDDIMLMAEGMIVYHGSRSNVLEYFEGFGFRCPERKGVADFLQEVMSHLIKVCYFQKIKSDYASLHFGFLSVCPQLLSVFSVSVLKTCSDFVFLFQMVDNCSPTSHSCMSTTVVSRKDQAKYWCRTEQAYSYVSVQNLSMKFKESNLGTEVNEDISKPFTRLPSHENAISCNVYSLSKWSLFRACMSREILLMKRNSFVYIFKFIQVQITLSSVMWVTFLQLLIIALITMTVFFRTRLKVDVLDANYYLGSLFYALVILLVDGFPELSMTVARLSVFYKQRDMYFYPAWAYAIPASILKIPLSMVTAIIWTSLTYYVIGYSPEPESSNLVHFPLKLTYTEIIRQKLQYYNVFPSASAIIRDALHVYIHVPVLCIIVSNCGCFYNCRQYIIFVSVVIWWLHFTIQLTDHTPEWKLVAASMPAWLKWGFWLSPLSYGEIGLTLNEFLSPRWNKMDFANGKLSNIYPREVLGHSLIDMCHGSLMKRMYILIGVLFIIINFPKEVMPTNTTIGLQILQSRGLNFDGYYFWISLGALFSFAMLFNIGFILALSYLKAPGTRAIISKEKLYQVYESEGSKNHTQRDKTTKNSSTDVSKPYEGNMVLPFEPLTITFQDLQYHVVPPPEMREHGFTGKRLELLSDITGGFRPGVLTALMGVSGAGKTTLLDVLAGRKTSGIVEGEIKIGGYPKVQETFARISGYCEQTDIHSPQITVEESVIFSAWLRLQPEIDSKTKYKFIEEILEIVELYAIKDALVGIPGVSGLSTEQRKRLTIAVEVIANPSIIFMDEPTTGLDARSAAIVMRAVKNIVDTGRTILILLKSGGRMIYCGPLGRHSSSVIEYLESIPGVPKIRDNYNPATWMLEVTSASMEAELGVDFAKIYSTSALYKSNKEVVNTLSKPPPGSKELYFPTRFPQNGWGQFKACLWKQRLSYWRSPSYNLMRSLHMLFASFIFGLLFWDQGRKIHNQQSLFNILASMYSAVLFCGINNSSSVLPYVSMERTVVYRERFSGMYASWAYALAQVAIEFPYLFAQSLAFTCITYPMIGYYWSIYKVFWYFYAFLCTLMYFTYLGMLLVAITPNFPVAAILQSTFYTMFNLFGGFLIPKPKIPGWWIWLYYATPTSWSLNAMLTSQYGDVTKEIVVFGETKRVEAFLRDYFGYHHDELPIAFILLALYPIVLASLFAYCIAKLNFQRR